VSLVFQFFFLSIQLINFICFQDQGRRNDLYSKCVSPVPQDLMTTPGISKIIKSASVHCHPLSCVAYGSRCHTADYLKEMKVVDSSVPFLSSSLLKSHTVSTNIKSDSVHCDPLSCMASGSRCHTADYLKEMKDVDSSVPCLNSSILKSPAVSTNIKSDSVHCDPLSCVASGSRCHTADYLNVTKGVDASIPCLMYSHSKPPPPGSMCSPSPVQTPLSAHSVHLLLLLMLIVQLYFIADFAVHKRSIVNRIISFKKW
jgi:hypothetical protein